MKIKYVSGSRSIGLPSLSGDSSSSGSGDGLGSVSRVSSSEAV
ncbi:MAG: hypothetical protein WC477_07295 [Patescibacteria group bacterium]